MRLPETEKGTEMTQYEVASLAVQYMGVWVAGAVGFAQCLLIGIGLLYMRRAAILRDRALDELIERTRSNHDEHMANHEAYMANHEAYMAMKKTWRRFVSVQNASEPITKKTWHRFVRSSNARAEQAHKQPATTPKRCGKCKAWGETRERLIKAGLSRPLSATR